VVIQNISASFSELFPNYVPPSPFASKSGGSWPPAPMGAPPLTDTHSYGPCVLRDWSVAYCMRIMLSTFLSTFFDVFMAVSSINYSAELCFHLVRIVVTLPGFCPVPTASRTGLRPTRWHVVRVGKSIPVQYGLTRRQSAQVHYTYAAAGLQFHFYSVSSIRAKLV